MKKYLLGIFAVALAIGFSAFTSPATKKVNSDDSPLHWYLVNYNGAQMEIQPQTPVAYGTKIEVAPGIDCEGTTRTCAAGFAEELPFTDDEPVINDDGDEQLEEDVQ